MKKLQCTYVYGQKVHIHKFFWQSQRRVEKICTSLEEYCRSLHHVQFIGHNFKYAGVLIVSKWELLYRTSIELAKSLPSTQMLIQLILGLNTTLPQFPYKPYSFVHCQWEIIEKNCYYFSFHFVDSSFTIKKVTRIRGPAF